MNDTNNTVENTTVYTSSNGGTPIENPNIPALVNDGIDIDKLDFGSSYASPNGGNDTITGTEGANTFEINLLLNATSEVIQPRIERDGTINWQQVTNANDNYHDHWLESIGEDTIVDFSGSGGEGDTIEISGHTVSAVVLSESDNQVKLGLYADQSQDGYRSGGAHDFDVVGTLTIQHDGNFDYNSDVSVNPGVFDGAYNNVFEFSQSGEQPGEPIVDDLTDESFEDTTVYTASNGGTPIENSNIPALVNDGSDIGKLDFSSQYASPNGGNDTIAGTRGANTFEINLLLNATSETIAPRIDLDGRVNWQQVTNANDNYHDHWLESIGEDTIVGFSGSGGEGDKIEISGHTVSALVLSESENTVKLGLYADQSQDDYRSGGAHDFDVVGTLTIQHDGNFDYNSDVSVNPGVFDGAFESA